MVIIKEGFNHDLAFPVNGMTFQAVSLRSSFAPVTLIRVQYLGPGEKKAKHNHLSVNR